MLGDMIYLSSDWTQTVGRKCGCSRNTLMKECLTLLARHGCVCIRKYETNGFQVSVRKIDRIQAFGSYQQKNCSFLTRSVLLRRYVSEKMALFGSGLCL
jgi:hypothetical protein